MMKPTRLFSFLAAALLLCAGCDMIPTVTPFSPLSQTVEINAAGGSITVAFSAPAAWSASCDAEWLTLSATSGEKGTNALTLSASRNDSGAERQVVISLNAAELNENGSITVSQKTYEAPGSDDPSPDPSVDPSPDPSVDPGQSDDPSTGPDISDDPSPDPSVDPGQSDDPSTNPGTSDDPSTDPGQSDDPSQNPAEPPIDGEIEDWDDGDTDDLKEE